MNHEALQARPDDGLPPLPPPTGWITDWKKFSEQRDACIYARCWRPSGQPHPWDVPMFTAAQMLDYARAAVAKDDGFCRSCDTAGKCTTGPECVACSNPVERP